MARRPVKANGDGTYRLNLSKNERAMVTTVVPQLRAMLAGNPDHETLIRLFPTARPDDPEAEADYRALVRDELVSKRLARLDTVGELAEATVINREQLAAWIGTVNDIRLVLGTRLEVGEADELDDASELPDPEDKTPESVALSAYYYLGWLLENLVEASASDL
ncbi:DUF2017 family protein [Candidatus Poriferisocius sp.]|uniref:DUF2017 family protein n=1 Tax=Candidatus Poriferisocius sp. TaxID=3101276 RepID=UPI003B01D958